ISNDSGGELPAKTETRFYIKDNLTTMDSVKTEEHVRKIMLSDLQTRGLEKAMEVQIPLLDSKQKNGVRKANIDRVITMLTSQLYSEFDLLQNSQLPLFKNKPIILEVGSVCFSEEYCKCRCLLWCALAKNTISWIQTWRRALVKDVDVFQKKAQVFYIDCGKEGNIPLSWIKALHKDIELFPPCVSSIFITAIKCSFASYDPDQQGCSQDFAILSSQLVGKSCSVTVVDVLPDEMMSSFAVDFVLSKCSSERDSKESKEKIREEKELESKEKIHEEKELRCCGNLTAERVSVCIGDTFSAVISHVQNPEDFFCQQIHIGQDNIWYRATVIAYTAENNVLVGYIDYGNYEVLQPTRLRPMIPKLMDLPAQAIRCTLAGIKPSLRAWTSDAISLMKELVKDKVLTVKVVDKESCKSVVELIDASVIPEVNISRYFIGKGCAAGASGMALQATETHDVKQADQDMGNKRYYKWNKLPLNHAVDVIVCTLYSPGEFYCQTANDSHALNSLNKSLFEYCQKTPPNPFKLKKGEACCALFSDDGHWYRALVEKVASDRNVKVHFVDYGNVEEVPLDMIRQIPSSFLQLPFQGVKCWLSGIKPTDSKWKPEATARFHKCTAGMKLQARIISFSRDGTGVELIDNSMGYPKRKASCSAFMLFLIETSLGRWESIELAVDQTVPVCVTEVISPDLFYALPVHCKDEENLFKQFTELQDYCESCKKQPFRPKQGEACCARFSGDGCWYRALVLEVSQSTVQVLYADYGNIEIIPLSNVLPITGSYLKVPFQTIICSLAGIKKVEWSPLVLGTFKKMLLKKYVTITVKGINGSVKLVQVEKQSENSSVNVADKLVMEGLVKYCKAENSGVVHQGSQSETKCCCAELKMRVGKKQS
ncbi:hypothetical protein ASZ78_006717, partial [Callipepla squamata]